MAARAGPFRRPPMVDIPAQARDSMWQRATRRLIEARRWREVSSFADLCELSAEFCEGKLARTPGHMGPRAGETVRIGDELAHANRQGFLTSGSQPGEDDDGHQQRAAVEGFASPETVEKLRGLVAGTRLQMQVSTYGQRRTDYSGAYEATRQVYPDGSCHVFTEFGAVPGRNEIGCDFDRPDLVDGMAYVSIHDPDWGDHSLLWDRLAQPDWDRPDPPQPDTPSLTDHDRAVQRYADAERAARAQCWPGTDVDEITWYRERAERKRERFVQDQPTNEEPMTPYRPIFYPDVDAAVADFGQGADEHTRKALAAARQGRYAEADAHHDEAERLRDAQWVIRRAGRPTASTTAGGPGMTNIESARAFIMKAHQDAQTGLAQLANAHESLEDAQAGLRHGTEGSNQAEADQANGLLASAMDKIEEARAQVAAALQEFEGVAQRL